ncbi:MAG: hypothetical protein QF479_03120 [Candidatus Poseidoniaceae archaeon]|jgi:hypothetical protein|nr:hypothetical protein [Candidatus Poseidoniaceae archaeon]
MRIAGRRKKELPLNPFARNAAAERNKRQAERANVRKREESATAQAPINSAPKAPSSSLAEMQKKAAKRLENDKIITAQAEQKPAQLPKPTITVTKKLETEEKVKNDIREQLNRKTAEANKKYQEITSNATEETSQIEPEIIEVTPAIESTPPEVENLQDDAVPSEEKIPSNGTRNIFKTVEQTKKPSVTGDRRRRKRRMDKKGGGRQRMEKKLNRQKILAFKYFARDLLDDPNIPEEHRSNVLGQIIAKGERTSIEAAVEFIQQKREELILTDEVANSLINEIKSMTTRR